MTGPGAATPPSGADALEAEVRRRLEVADRRWAQRAAAAVPVLATTLLVGAGTTIESAGTGSGARPGNVLSWLALFLLAGVLVAAAWPGRPDPRSASLATAGGSAVVLALTLRSAVTAEAATPWPLVGALACAWVLGCVAAEALRRRDDPRAAEPAASVTTLAAFRRSGRSAVTDASPPK